MSGDNKKRSIVFTVQFLIIYLSLLFCSEHPEIYPLAKGWARNSVNAVIFRKNSVVTHDSIQYVGFYNDSARLILAKRLLGSSLWEIRKTPYSGNVKDAHNAISIMTDKEGYLHLSWDHHNNPLRYCISRKPGSLELSPEMPMTGLSENRVSYPEFYKLPDDNLIFLYRDGSSGNGNIMINYYDTDSKSWTKRQNGFIDGQGQRNAYWQAAVDPDGVLHISWVWRESGDVATNHDLCYARSDDAGATWTRSNGKQYRLPITAENAEYICRIPQNSELINQTSMCVDSKGHPYIASYWRPQNSAVPQYSIVYFNGSIWKTSQVTSRKTPFSLKGGGTKRIPISRPQIMVKEQNNIVRLYMLFRDIERQNRVSIALCEDINRGTWSYKDLTTFSVNAWEPSFDTELWKHKKLLHIFVQNVGQGDQEQMEDLEAQMVSILEWKPES